MIPKPEGLIVLESSLLPLLARSQIPRKKPVIVQFRTVTPVRTASRMPASAYRRR